jgi:hypothetical protein
MLRNSLLVERLAASKEGQLRELVPSSAVPQLGRLVAGFPPRRPGLSHVGFVVDKVTLGQVFSKSFDLPCQFSFHQLLHIH